MLSGLIANSHDLLAAFVDCKEQKAWRAGRQKYLYSYGQYVTPLGGQQSDITAARATITAQLCEQMNKSTKKEIIGDVKKRLKEQVNGAKFSNMRLLTESNHDDIACYFSSLQHVATPDGKNRVIVGISAMTLIKGKLLQLNLYDRYKNDQTIKSMMRHQKKNLADLVNLDQNK